MSKQKVIEARTADTTLTAGRYLVTGKFADGRTVTRAMSAINAHIAFFRWCDPEDETGKRIKGMSLDTTSLVGLEVEKLED